MFFYSPQNVIQQKIVPLWPTPCICSRALLVPCWFTLSEQRWSPDADDQFVCPGFLSSLCERWNLGRLLQCISWTGGHRFSLYSCEDLVQVVQMHLPYCQSTFQRVVGARSQSAVRQPVSSTSPSYFCCCGLCWSSQYWMAVEVRGTLNNQAVSLPAVAFDFWTGC